ncbi:MAG TPA: dTMP kinase [Candidatus Cybelea sp.]|jgi:dTMP kinase
MFIVVEGIEGSGKSTLLRGLVERLRMDGRDVVITREPGGTATGDAIRTIFLDRTLNIKPLTEALLVNAARAQHVAEVIRPALDAGRLLLCDRFISSTLAYQGYGRGFDLAALQRLCDEATGKLEADLVFLLDLPVDLARKRMAERSYQLDRIESEDAAFHERVRQGYLVLAKSPRFRKLDATQPVETLLDVAWSFISTL